jgi:hypothetical protein
MSSDIFEKNVANMVRHAALRVDDARAGRAREKFLRGTAAPPEGLSWKFAAVAAAALVIITIVWSARTERPAGTAGSTPAKEPSNPASPAAVQGGNDLLRGTFTLLSRGARFPKLRFAARSSLPAGLCFTARMTRMEEQLAGNRLTLTVLDSMVSTPELRNGAFEEEWEQRQPVMIRLDVSAPDHLQERDLVKHLKVPEPKRKWTFEFSAWDEKICSRLGPQLAEVADIAREVREFVGRVEASCATEALFKDRQKALIDEAERFKIRAENFARTGLYPASTSQIGFIARNLEISIAIFKWEDGKFAGPKDYHTDNKKGLTHRRDPFEFEMLRKYLDEAVVVAGREFDLWILKDVRRAGLEDLHHRIVKEQEKRPGVSEFAEQLQSLPGQDSGALELEIRALKKDR